MTELTLERKPQPDDTVRIGRIMMTPPIDKDYWLYRVKLSELQAIVGFPKFSTIGIGFAVEDDWNTNLPFTQTADEIFAHIAHNKGDEAISDADCIAAIRLVQGAAQADRAKAR
jgi:hypothetical protein